MTSNRFQDGFRGAGEFEPVAAAPLFGLRQWRVDARPSRGSVDLTSTFLRIPWLAGENVAQCQVSLVAALMHYQQGSTVHLGHDVVPLEGCQCGFWAYSPPPGEPVMLQDLGGHTVVGIIEAWGRTIVGTLGFRAERARIVALAFPGRGATNPAVVSSGTYALQKRVIPILNELCTEHDHDHGVPVGHWEGFEPEVQAALGRKFPAAAQFPTIEAMLAEFPLTDLAELVGPS